MWYILRGNYYMKQKLICLSVAALLLFVLCGCAQEACSPVGSAPIPAEAQQSAGAGEEQSNAEPGGTASQSESVQSAGPEGTTVTGESEIGGMPKVIETDGAANFFYDEVYKGDGYSFRYPKDSKILTDTETAKSFQLPEGYVLNMTRLNLSGQEIAFSKALEVYRKALEEQGNTVLAVDTLKSTQYENALIEMEIKNGNEKAAAAQVFLLADESNYTFTLSAKDANMETLKKIVSDIVKTFLTA